MVSGTHAYGNAFEHFIILEVIRLSSYYYQEAEDHQAVVLTQRIKDIAATRVRYGCRRIYIMLRREGFNVNHKRIYRLYCRTGLQLRNKTPKRR